MSAPIQRVGLRPFRPISFGRFTLLAPLAAGGMGEIYLARATFQGGLDKLCVIKKVLPQLAEDPEFVERFLDEARTLVALQHGSIAQVYDTGSFEESYWIAMEFVDGKDLRRLIQRARSNGSRIPVVLSLYIATKVLEALAYAHRRKDESGLELGLVHRDVSPQNILVSYDGEVKVIDFGLAKSKLSLGQSKPEAVLGKLYYMPPEQALGGQVDRRSDIYALGLVLYELLVGHNPFEDVEQEQLFTRICAPRIRPVREIDPTLPLAIGDVLGKALAPNPEARYRNAEQMRAAISACLSELAPDVGPEQLATYVVTLFSEEHERERETLARFALGTAREGERFELGSVGAHDETRPVVERMARAGPGASEDALPLDGPVGEPPGAAPAADPAPPHLAGPTQRFADPPASVRADDAPIHLNAPTLRGSGLPDLPWDRRATARPPRVEAAEATSGPNPWYEELGEEDRLHRLQLAREGRLRMEAGLPEGGRRPGHAGDEAAPSRAPAAREGDEGSEAIILATPDEAAAAPPRRAGSSGDAGSTSVAGADPHLDPPPPTSGPPPDAPLASRRQGATAVEGAPATPAGADWPAPTTPPAPASAPTAIFAAETEQRRDVAGAPAGAAAGAGGSAGREAVAPAAASTQPLFASKPARPPRRQGLLAAAALILLVGAVGTYWALVPSPGDGDGRAASQASQAPEGESEAQPPSEPPPAPAGAPAPQPTPTPPPPAPLERTRAEPPAPPPPPSSPAPTETTPPPPAPAKAPVEAPPLRSEGAAASASPAPARPAPSVDRRQELIRRREALRRRFDELIATHGPGPVGSIVIDLERAMGSSFDRFIDAPEQYEELERQLGELESILEERRRALR